MKMLIAAIVAAIPWVAIAQSDDLTNAHHACMRYHHITPNLANRGVGVGYDMPECAEVEKEFISRRTQSQAQKIAPTAAEVQHRNDTDAMIRGVAKQLKQ